jgi:hypothetical protein
LVGPIQTLVQRIDVNENSVTISESFAQNFQSRIFSRQN